jgi:hypothetical protein
MPPVVQVEAVAVEHDADDRSEHNQGDETGKNRVNQTFLTSMDF